MLAPGPLGTTGLPCTSDALGISAIHGTFVTTWPQRRQDRTSAQGYL